MSYKQIFRRANRILKSTVNDFLDQFTKEEQELADFDEQLRRPAQKESQRQSSAGQGQEGRAPNRQAGSRQPPRAEGKRKPGEKDDAYYFTVLGLTPAAGHDEIKNTYKRLMRRYHPDVVANLSPQQQAAAAAKASSINEAYHIIERRRGYK